VNGQRILLIAKPSRSSMQIIIQSLQKKKIASTKMAHNQKTTDVWFENAYGRTRFGTANQSKMNSWVESDYKNTHAKGVRDARDKKTNKTLNTIQKQQYIEGQSARRGSLATKRRIG
jgi:hypothetical protein